MFIHWNGAGAWMNIDAAAAASDQLKGLPRSIMHLKSTRPPCHTTGITPGARKAATNHHKYHYHG